MNPLSLQSKRGRRGEIALIMVIALAAAALIAVGSLFQGGTKVDSGRYPYHGPIEINGTNQPAPHY